MKYTTIIMQTITAGALIMGLAAQATAADATQVRFEVGSPALGGTREGVHRQRVEVEINQAADRDVAQSLHAGPSVDNPTQGTRG